MQTDLQDQLQRLNERWNRAWLERDAATVERLMADDYLYVGPGGFVLDRAGILNVIRSPDYRLDYSTRTDLVVRAIGDSGDDANGADAALVRHRARAGGAFEGKTFDDDHVCVMICERRPPPGDGQWRIVMEQHSLSGK